MKTHLVDQQIHHMEMELNAAKKVLAAEKSSLQKLRRRKRSYLLLQAGLLFEEAGILYDYDPDVVLALLRELKNGGEDDGRNQGSTRAAR